MTQVTLSLVVNSRGSFMREGSSRALSSDRDRTRFLERRRMAGAILIGGNTARVEPYEKTPVPLIIVSRSMVRVKNPRAQIWNCTPKLALHKARELYGDGLHIEGGPHFFQPILDDIKSIFLTITDDTYESDVLFDWRSAFREFNVTSEEIIEKERFLELHR